MSVEREEKRAEPETLKNVSRRAAEQAEIAMIRRVMEEVRWNRRTAARQLGVSYKTLWNKLKEYGLG